MAETNLNARERAQLEEKKKDRQTRNRFIIIGAIVLVLAALVLVVNSRLFTNVFPALKVTDGTTVTNYPLASVNYEYQSTYMQFYQQYGSYGLINNSTPLDQQTCIFDSNGGTWADYFKKSAEENLIERTAMVKAAAAAGYTELTEDEQAQIDEVIENYAAYAQSYGYGSVDSYLALNYGAGNNEKTVRENLKQQMLGTRFLQDLYNSYTYSDEELDAYYSENADELNKVSYLYTVISAEDAGAENADEAQEADLTKAREDAESIVETADGDETLFRTAVAAVTGSEAIRTSNTVSSFLNMFEGAVSKEDLTEGTVFTHESEGSVYIVYVLGVDDNSYSTVNVRHILVKAVDADGDGVFSDEEKQTAYDAAKAIEEEWLAGDATEESFAALANEKSEDTGSNTNGGLYDAVHKGQMVEEFNDFCFEGHQPGDTAIVYGETSSYAGYHVVYYVGEGEQYSDTLARNALNSSAISDWLSALLENYTVTTGFASRWVG